MMKARTRSITGALMMAVVIPIFAGLLACMPVPIGNPERSRIDPAMNGFWILSEENRVDGLYLFRPYDKRTWLVIGLEVWAGKEADFDNEAIRTPDGLIAAFRAHPLGSKGLDAEDAVIYKSWLAKIGGRRFMTWEAVGDIHYPDSFSPEGWYVFSMEETHDDHYRMRILAPDDDVFEELIEATEEEGWDPWKARRQWERTLRRNIRNPELYSHEAYEMHRLPDDLFDKAANLVDLVIGD